MGDPNPSTATFYFSGLKEGNVIEVYDMLGQCDWCPDL